MDLNTVLVNLIIGVILLYLNWYQQTSVWQKLNLDYAYYFNVILNYLSKDPRVSPDHKFTGFTLSTVFNKFFILQFIYHPEHFRAEAFQGTMQDILIFLVIGFSIPNKFLVKMHSVKWVNTLLGQMDIVTNSGFVYRVLSFTVLRNYQEMEFNNILVYMEFLAILMGVGCVSSLINLSDQYMRIDQKTAIKKAPNTIKWSFLSYFLGGCFMIFILQNYVQIKKVQKSLGIYVDVLQEEQQEKQDELFSKEIIFLWMNSWWIVYTIGKQTALFFGNSIFNKNNSREQKQIQNQSQQQQQVQDINGNKQNNNYSPKNKKKRNSNKSPKNNNNIKLNKPKVA